MKNQISESFKKDYHLCEEIGRGKFGVVYHCISTSTGDSYAAKCLDKRQLLSDDLDSRCLEIEPKLLQILAPHPNILQIHDLYGSDPDSNHLIIITELCDNSTLYDRLTLSLFTESDACNVITQIISALAHCHRHGIAHRDIKPENVLFDSTGRRVKLIDFGSAEWFGDHKRDGEMMSGVVGTPYYVAPEVLLGREYDEKIDVWSVGVILYIMLGGVPPFYGDGVEEIFRAVIRGNLRFPTKSFRSVSTEAKDLIRKMLCKDSSRRLSAEQVLRHPWILSGGINNSLADSGI